MAENAREFGIEYFNEFDKRQGIVHVDRPRAGLYAARHHHRLRRQPHLHPWRVRRAGARHRHLRSRACAGDANADPEKGQEHARHRRRQIAGRRHRQGHHPRHHRRDRHRRRHRLCAGICRRGDPRAVDGRPHDGLQHVDRGRRPRRPDRARREGVRISCKGRPKSPKGEAWDAAMRYWETLRSRRGAHFDHEIRLDAAKLPPIVTWGTSPEDVVSIIGLGARSRQDRRRSQAARQSIAR